MQLHIHPCDYCKVNPSTGKYLICGEYVYHCDACKQQARDEMEAYEDAQATELVSEWSRK